MRDRAAGAPARIVLSPQKLGRAVILESPALGSVGPGGLLFGAPGMWGVFRPPVG